MPYELRFTPLSQEHLAGIRVFERRRILDDIRSELTHAPAAETRRKKVLNDVIPSFPFNPPLRELRVGEYRVFYDVDEEANCVTVRSVRHKPPEKTTEDILHETGNS